MTYQVIARKWRPQTFEEVVGQEAITRTLQNAIADKRLHHAYIFAGPRGVGKTTTARIFARALNCLTGPTTNPCGTCPACTEIARGSSIDVQEIDAATHTQVDNVREVIINTIGMTPARDRYKIFIIDEVHQLSNHAFNALLKTLEEPPAHVLFMMATTERHKVPDTILSRCQFFEFRLIAEKSIFDRLRLIAEQEEITITDSGLHKVSRAGEGSMRDAQSVFDQVISFAGHRIRDEDVVEALGIVGTEILVRVSEAISDGDSSKVLRLVGELVERGFDLRYFSRELMAHFRNLLVLKSVGYDSELIELTSSEVEALKPLLTRFSDTECVRAFHILTEVEQNLRYSTDPRFQLEIGLIRLAHVGRLRSVAELVARLETLERCVRGDIVGGSGTYGTTDAATSQGAPGTPDDKPQTTTAVREDRAPVSRKGQKPPSSQTREPAATGVAFAPAVEAGDILEKIRAVLDERGKMLLSATLAQVRTVEMVDDTLRIVCAGHDGLLKETLREKQNVKLIEAIALEIVGRPIKLKVVIEAASERRQPAVQDNQASLLAEAERDPTVKALLKTFKGELTRVVPKRKGKAD